jgi:hypothetical protein
MCCWGRQYAIRGSLTKGKKAWERGGDIYCYVCKPETIREKPKAEKKRRPLESLHLDLPQPAFVRLLPLPHANLHRTPLLALDIDVGLRPIRRRLGLTAELELALPSLSAGLAVGRGEEKGERRGRGECELRV